MKKIMLASFLLAGIMGANAQIYNATGGTILPNATTTNTNVGIGTNAPVEALHIRAGQFPKIKIESTYGPSWNIGFQTPSRVGFFSNSSSSVGFMLDTGARDFFVIANNKSNIQIRATNDDTLFFNEATGRTIIGTTTDNLQDMLQVNGSVVATRIKKSGGTSSQFLMADGSITTAVATNTIYTADGTLSGARTITMGTSPINFNGTGNFMINAGNVGIGTTNPTEKLQVNGNVLATSFKKLGDTDANILLAGGGVAPLSSFQNALTSPTTGVGSNLSPNTFATQDGTVLYHSVKWFTPTGTISTNGTTATIVGAQFLNTMVGAKLTINGEWRIITAYISTTQVTVASAYSVNYSAVAAANWGVYSKSFANTDTLNSSPIYNVSYTKNNTVISCYNINNDYISKSNYSIFNTLTASSFFSYGTNAGIRFSSANNDSMTDLRLKRLRAGLLQVDDGTPANSLRDLATRKLLVNTTTDNGTDAGQFNGSVIATSFKKLGGTSSQFLMADGSTTTTTNANTLYTADGTLSEPRTITMGANPINFNGTGKYIINAGNVGIGTANPDQKLTVKGKIHTEEVIVDLSVPADYVFQKYYTGKSELKADYVMPTLAEIESFSKKNNHLPNIPSAKEMQKNGLSLGEMSNLLLQKVEELTLYAIEQQKEIESLKKENEQYKSLVERVAALEKK